MLSTAETAYLLAAILVPMFMLWIYLRIALKKEELQKRSDADYKEMIRSTHVQQSLRFEPSQSDTFSGVNASTYTLNLKNRGDDIANLSLLVSSQSNIKKIFTASDIKSVKQDEEISLILHLNKGKKQQTPMHENSLPENTIFSVKYDTVKQEGVLETYQLVIEYHPQNSIVRLIKTEL